MPTPDDTSYKTMAKSLSNNVLTTAKEPSEKPTIQCLGAYETDPGYLADVEDNEEDPAPAQTGPSPS